MKIFPVLILFGILSAGSLFAQPPPNLKVVTTLFPLQEFARCVGGERVQASLLLPPGAEPHDWEPKPSDISKIYRADIFIYLSRAMEPWVHDILRATQRPHLKVMEASRGLPLLRVNESKPPPPHNHKREQADNFDPHIWLDFSHDQKIIDAIVAVFSARDPLGAPIYAANATGYKAKLDALDKKFQISLHPCRYRKMFVGGHAAFAYLAQRYGLQQIALYGVSPNAEPTPKKLIDVIRAAKEHGVQFIFFEEMVNPKLAQVLAQEAGIGILPLYNGANLTREQVKRKISFLELMEKNLENLRRGLACKNG